MKLLMLFTYTAIECVLLFLGLAYAAPVWFIALTGFFVVLCSYLTLDTLVEEYGYG